MLDAQLMTRMFGEEAVCADDAQPCELTEVAREWMKATNATLDKGRSEGFATLSLLFFSGELAPEDFGSERVADLRLEGNVALQQELAYWAATQAVPGASKGAERFEAKDVLSFLAEALSPESESHYRLALAQRTSHGFQRGHALTPIGYYKAAREDGESAERYLLRVYDNNFPQRERAVEFWPKENRWRYEVTGVEGDPIVYEGSDETQNFLYFAPVEAKLGLLPAPFAADAQTISLTYSGVSVLADRGDGEKTGIRDGEVFEAEGEFVTPAFASCPLCGTPVAIVNQVMLDRGFESVLLDVQASEDVQVDKQVFGSSQDDGRDDSRFVAGTGANYTSKVYMDGDNFEDSVSFDKDGDVTYEAQDNSGGIVVVSTSKDEETGQTTSLRVVVPASNTKTKVKVTRNEDGTLDVDVEGLPDGATVYVETTTSGNGMVKRNSVGFEAEGGKPSKTTLNQDTLEASVQGAKSSSIGNCTNTRLDQGLESDVDCGGQCGGCVDGKMCAVDGDCQGGTCASGICSAVQCSDGVKNGTETAVDCGGALCLACVATTEFPAPACLAESDCTGGACIDGLCRKKAPVKLRVDRVPSTQRSGLVVYYELDGVASNITLPYTGAMNDEVTLGEAYTYRLLSSDLCTGDTSTKKTGKQSAQDTSAQGLIELECPPDGQYPFRLKLSTFGMGRYETYLSSVPADDPIKLAVTLDGVEQIISYTGSASVLVGTYTSSWSVRILSTPQKNYDSSFGPASQGGLTCQLYYGTSYSDYRRASLSLQPGQYGYPVTQTINCFWRGSFGCMDNAINQDESDKNCGGTVCGTRCAAGKMCASNSDCETGTCGTSHRCELVAGTCSDSAKNQDETDTDCGGMLCAARCALGDACLLASDCATQSDCVNNLCALSPCFDSSKSGDETDVDCGGATCSARCADGKACAQASDCQAGLACSTSSVCTSDLCNDGLKDNGESDIDCGGASCAARCAQGESCRASSDCTSGLICENTLCAPDPCFDSSKNGDETDVDCGGTTCSARCAAGQSCSGDADCAGGTCSGGVCGMAPCSNGVKDGSETDIDCGGSTCAACPVTSACLLDTDCASSDCECAGSSGSCMMGAGTCGAGQLFVDQPVTDGTSASATYTIPASCTSVFVQAWGAAGGASDQMGFAGTAGGAGGYVEGTLAVAPGDQVTVWLGQGGTSGFSMQGSGSYLGAPAPGGTGGFAMFGADEPGGGGGLTSVQITGSATQSFSVPAGAGGGDFVGEEINVMVTPGATTTGYAGAAGGNSEPGGGAGDPGGASGNAGAYGTLPAGLIAHDSLEDPNTFEFGPAKTSNSDYSRCQGANMIAAGQSDLALGVGGDGCVILRCVGQ